MANARVVVTTCDRYMWLLKPFAHLFNTFWSQGQPVLVGGYSRPAFSLPNNFSFHSISATDYPANRWSDGIIRLLQSIGDDYFVWMLEDMFINRAVDYSMVDSLVEYARIKGNILRIDLTADRLYNKDPRFTPDFDIWGRANLIQSHIDWPYHVSLQAGLWNRERLLQIIRPGMTPWDFELESAPYVAQHQDWLVLGTRQIPIQYTLVSSQDPRKENLNLKGVPQDMLNEMQMKGVL